MHCRSDHQMRQRIHAREVPATDLAPGTGAPASGCPIAWRSEKNTGSRAAACGWSAGGTELGSILVWSPTCVRCLATLACRFFMAFFLIFLALTFGGMSGSCPHPPTQPPAQVNCWAVGPCGSSSGGLLALPN